MKADHIWENNPWAVKLSASALPSLVLEASLPGKVHLKGSFFISSSHPAGLRRYSQLRIRPPGQDQAVPGLVHDTNIKLPGKQWYTLGGHPLNCHCSPSTCIWPHFLYLHCQPDQDLTSQDQLAATIYGRGGETFSAKEHLDIYKITHEPYKNYQLKN